jgi:hypothetical protein
MMKASRPNTTQSERSTPSTASSRGTPAGQPALPLFHRRSVSWRPDGHGVWHHIPEKVSGAFILRLCQPALAEEVRAELATALQVQRVRLIQQVLLLPLTDGVASNDEQVDVRVHGRVGGPHVAARRGPEHPDLHESLVQPLAQESAETRKRLTLLDVQASHTPERTARIDPGGDGAPRSSSDREPAHVLDDLVESRRAPHPGRPRTGPGRPRGPRPACWPPSTEAERGVKPPVGPVRAVAAGMSSMNSDGPLAARQSHASIWRCRLRGRSVDPRSPGSSAA